MRISLCMMIGLVVSLPAYALDLPFSPVNENGPTLTIAAVGDVLLHEPLQRKAVKDGFMSLWEQAIPYIKNADIAYANLEGPMAYGVSKTGKVVTDPGHQVDNYVYSSYPLFNYHPKLADALKDSGFDIVSTANNHSLDRYNIGIERTIEALQKAGIAYTGTRFDAKKQPIYTLLKRKGFTLAWLACTQDTNGMQDKKAQVIYCFRKADRQAILDAIAQLRSQVDAIIVSPHWGIQYQHQPTSLQKAFAKQVLEAGATAVIGSHPHVLQPIKHYITKDKRETLIAYSLGNFVSYQGTPKNRSTVILQIELMKTASNGTIIKDVNVIPAYMQNRSGAKNITLDILSEKDKSQIGYQIIRKVLGLSAT